MTNSRVDQLVSMYRVFDSCDFKNIWVHVKSRSEVAYIQSLFNVPFNYSINIFKVN